MSEAFKGFEAMQDMVKDMPNVTIKGVSCELTSFRDGQFPVHCGFWEHELIRLFDAYAPDRDNGWREYGVTFENDTFWVHPDYDYGDSDCECAYAVQEKAWLVENTHSSDCFQPYISTLVRQCEDAHPLPQYELFDRMDDFDIAGMIEMFRGGPAPTPEMKLAHDQKQVRRQAEHSDYFAASKIRDEAVTRLVLKEAKARNVTGDSVKLKKDNANWMWQYLCTCGHDTRHHQWQMDHEHFKPCEHWWGSQPNFIHKPSGYGVHWYKYPCRDAYGTQAISPAAFSELIDKCIASLEVEAR